LRVYANGWYAGSDTPEEYASAALKTVEKGFTALKFDPIPGPFRSYIPKTHENQAVETVKRVREAVGDDIDLLIEVHRRLSPMHAISLARRIEEYDLYWFEEPLKPDALGDYTLLRKTAPLPIAGGEVLTRRQSFLPWLEEGAFDIVQPDVTKVGGITESRRIAWTAQEKGIKFIPHGWNTAVGLAADLQLASAFADTDLVEYIADSPYVDGIVAQPWSLDEDGMLPIPDTPGLSIQLNSEALAAYVSNTDFINCLL